MRLRNRNTMPGVGREKRRGCRVGMLQKNKDKEKGKGKEETQRRMKQVE
jgi:hypothetical protein